jgi:hypothetical protein
MARSYTLAGPFGRRLRLGRRVRLARSRAGRLDAWRSVSGRERRWAWIRNRPDGKFGAVHGTEDSDGAHCGREPASVGDIFADALPRGRTRLLQEPGRAFTLTKDSAAQEGTAWMPRESWWGSNGTLVLADGSRNPIRCWSLVRVDGSIPVWLGSFSADQAGSLVSRDRVVIELVDHDDPEVR